MKKEDAIEQGSALVDKSTVVMLGTSDAEGYPNIRAMIKMENDGLKTIWLSTNTSSRKITQLKDNPKACAYFVDLDGWMGVMLVGTVNILRDAESRQRLWREGFERYYPSGVDDPDYSVLRFTGQWGRYYYKLAHATFEL